MATKRLLAVVTGKGALPLGSKAKVSQGGFSGGVSTTKKAARINTGKNTANARVGKANSKSSLNFSNKDGQRQAGSPAKSGKSRGPSGIRSKKGRLK